MTPAEYLRTKAKYRAEYEAKLHSLDMIWSDQSDGAPPPESIDSHGDAVLAVRGAWRLLAQRVIDEMPSGTQFTVNEIQNGIAAKNPLLTTDKVAISGFAKKLADENKVKILEPGAGRRATIYAKK